MYSQKIEVMTTEKIGNDMKSLGRHNKVRPTNVEEARWKYSWSISRRPMRSRGTDKKWNLSCKHVIKNLSKITSKSHSVLFLVFFQVTLHALHCFHGFCFFKVLPLATLSARTCRFLRHQNSQGTMKIFSEHCAPSTIQPFCRKLL